MIPTIETREGIEIEIFADSENSTTVVVRALTERQCATHVSIRLFYWVEYPNIGPLMLSKLDIVPLTHHCRSATGFSIRLADAEFVRAEPMKSFGQLEFFRREMDVGLLR